MALIEIIVPCYNYGRYLPDCIGSLVAQSERDWRAVIIDDASPDGSAAAAHRLAEQDPRVVVIAHAANRGAIATYNEGIAQAEAPFFLLLSADDMLAPGALERALTAMRRHPEVVLTYGASQDFDGPAPSATDPAPAEWRVQPGERFIAELCGAAVDFVPTPSVILRTEAQQAAGYYRPGLPHAGDLEMWLRVALHGAVAGTNAVQSFKRVHGANMSTAADDNVLRDYLQRAAAFDSFFEGPGAAMQEASRLDRLVRRRLAGRAFWTAMAQLARGNRQTAFGLLRLVGQLSPATLVAPPLGPLLRAGR
jgi:glycosyltransferase involved in cell wall biosynthesis